ncbi:hypothetical protein C8R44DRAFT_745375 [Mycena epipterygia]|nr:hypothetical protein C8R44DRAFT_745375 [Mycena epipterygia]
MDSGELFEKSDWIGQGKTSTKIDFKPSGSLKKNSPRGRQDVHLRDEGHSAGSKHRCSHYSARCRFPAGAFRLRTFFPHSALVSTYARWDSKREGDQNKKAERKHLNGEGGGGRSTGDVWLICVRNPSPFVESSIIGANLRCRTHEEGKFRWGAHRWYGAQADAVISKARPNSISAPAFVTFLLMVHPAVVIMAMENTAEAPVVYSTHAVPYVRTMGTQNEKENAPVVYGTRAVPVLRDYMHTFMGDTGFDSPPVHIVGMTSTFVLLVWTGDFMSRPHQGIKNKKIFY